MQQAVDERADKQAARRREIWSWISVFIWSILLALFITNVVIVNAEVISGSMRDTIGIGERVMGNRMAYWFGEPSRYDIVMFNFKETRLEVENGVETEVEVNQIYVKRVIGEPGDKVEIKGGKVYINNEQQALPDSFTLEMPLGDYGPFYVPRNHYFMLGDNRNNSYDSRMWEDAFVYKRDILGKVMFVYYPNPRWVEKVEEVEEL